MRPADLAQIVGLAGAGETTAATTIVGVCREAGYEVLNATLARNAADTLQQEAGIQAFAQDTPT